MQEPDDKLDWMIGIRFEHPMCSERPTEHRRRVRQSNKIQNSTSFYFPKGCIGARDARRKNALHACNDVLGAKYAKIIGKPKNWRTWGSFGH